MRGTVLAAIGIAVGLAVVPARADELQMPAAPARQATVLPERGASMAQVEQRFGVPTQRISPVGQPPIARWVYPSFVVYFEGNLVIHAVATPTSSAPQT
jgi:hypothetical protein